MIPVEPAEEPVSFDAKVRKPGLRCVAERVGEEPPRSAGRRFKKVAATRDEIPAGKFEPYWREASDDLLVGYYRICAYLCLYIPRGIGAPSVDHMRPKSVRWDTVYEWDNYRLACSLMNSRKGTDPGVLDPFKVKGGWFSLELVGFQVIPGEGLSPDVGAAVRATIDRLRLSDEECCAARAEFAQAYRDGHVSFDYVTRHAPFVASELFRQGRLLPGDE